MSPSPGIRCHPQIQHQLFWNQSALHHVRASSGNSDSILAVSTKPMLILHMVKKESVFVLHQSTWPFVLQNVRNHQSGLPLKSSKTPPCLTRYKESICEQKKLVTHNSCRRQFIRLDNNSVISAEVGRSGITLPSYKNDPIKMAYHNAFESLCVYVIRSVILGRQIERMLMLHNRLQ
jgi:hypothetical protein